MAQPTVRPTSALAFAFDTPISRNWFLSEGGVVLAADSAATFGTLGQRTISQTTVKVEIVRGEALIATSGPVGSAKRSHSRRRLGLALLIAALTAIGLQRIRSQSRGS